MSESTRPDPDHVENPAAADLLWCYVERLGRGDELNEAEIRKEHPDEADELLRQLRALQEISADVPEEQGASLGTLGDYTLRRQIGRGGMGVVYEAWQNSMDRRVALKVLPVGIAADTRACARFMREAQTAGKLNHQNIVGVHSTGIEEGTPWYSMEYVEGEALAQILAGIKDAEPDTDTPFGAKDEVAYFHNMAKAFADVADGLQHAHSKGVVHRDIKPSNLILDGDGKLRILDFGLAHLEGQESLTLSGDVVGTPLYMSPEQAKRRKIPIDHRTDIYSLGATLYEMLTSHPPFRGKDHQDTLSQIIERDPAEPRKVNPRVPKDLETIILKCLRKEAGDRYGTAEALAQDLRRFVRGDPIEARPQAGWQRLVGRVKRRRKSILVAVAFGLLAGTVGWFAWDAEQSRRAQELATYEGKVLEAVTKLLAGRFSMEAGTKRSVGAFSFEGTNVKAAGPVSPEEIRALFGKQGSDFLVQAIHSLEQLAKTLPDQRDAHFYLAQAYALAGRDDDAIRAAQATLEVDRRFVPAQVLLRETAGTNPGPFADGYADDDWRSMWLRADAAFRDKDWRAASSAYGLLAELEVEPYIGSKLGAYIALGVAQLETKEYASAVGNFAVARNLAGGLEPTLLYAKALYLVDDQAAAEKSLVDEHERQSATGSGDVVAVLAAALYDSLRDYVRGLGWARKVRDPALGTRLEAFFYMRQGDTKGAMAAAELAITRNTRDPVARVIKGSILLRTLWSRPRDGPHYAADVTRLVRTAAAALDLGAGQTAQQLARAADELAVNALTRNLTRNETIRLKEQRKRLALAYSAAFGLQLGSVATGEDIIQIGPYSGRFDNVRAVEDVNSHPWWDGTPSISHDGTTLYFDSTRPGGLGGTSLETGRDIFMALRQDDGSFGEVTALSELNSEEVDTGFVVSSDGREGFFTSGRWGKTELYMARLGEGGGWTVERPLDEINDPEWGDAHAKIDCDSRTIVWMSDRPGGAGGLDIWMAARDDRDSPWGDVRNLREVNSTGDDKNPSLSCDALTLFFERDFDDIWVATRDSKLDRFSTPTRLGTPVNSPFIDVHPFIAPDWPLPGSKLYFARGMHECCDLDIFEATWVPDCNHNMIDDAEEIASGDAEDLNTNDIPDECESQAFVSFLRGDCNDDGTVDISDATCALNWLFAGGPTPDCLAAANANGDNKVDIADPVFLLNALFSGGPAPPTPFPDCGPDLTIDDLSCESFEGCE